LPTPRANEPGSTSVGYGDSLNDFANRVVKGYAPKDLLRTPAASEGERGHQPASKAKARGGQQTLSGQFIDLFPTVNTMEHREIKTPEQIATLKAKSPGGYRNLRETVVNELFPTPITSDYKNGKSSSGYGANLPETAKTLMPTPTTRDYKDGSQPHQRDGKVQTDTVARAVFNSGEIMLPTPQVDDSKNTGHNQTRRTTLASQVWANHETNWGKFEPAIRRWEAIIGRPAPEPTKPDGKEGNHRLSSKFTEWMMGLPDGWITDIGLKRNDELKACGNGVVPQQAELALSLLGIKEILKR
jgi:hypothetical protein